MGGSTARRSHKKPGDTASEERIPVVAPGPFPVLPAALDTTCEAMEAASQSFEASRPELQQIGEAVDRTVSYIVSRFTMGLAPAALAEAYFDWLLHLMASPGKQMLLAEEAPMKALRLARHAARCACEPGAYAPCVEPTPTDRRFSAPEWQQWPFNVIYQSFLLQEKWWEQATTGIHGVTSQHEREVAFAARQWLDMVSPSNFIATNPTVLAQTLKEGGANLVRGWTNLVEDWERVVSGRDPVGAEAFKVGDNIATTEGQVVYRNRLIELIQYRPRTAAVHPEPVLIVPAWIMKYYILDLSRQNSLVSYLLDQGYTVFMISWKNPGLAERDLGLEDYRTLGVMAALEAVERIAPKRAVHAVGYCLGGTLLAIAASAMSRGDVVPDGRRLATLSLFAAQTDFTEPGELALFINESQLAFLEDVMREQGFLSANQMAGAFQMLRSNDLVWSRVVRDYLMGERAAVSDLMAWNADATRMPARMHAEYLRRLFLDNDFAEGRYTVDGKPVAIMDVRAPIFAVGTETDHVAPWRSVYKLRLFTDTEVTFLLTSGGHNAGIVSEPGHAGRSYRVSTTSAEDTFIDPESWAQRTPVKQGSWWPEWVRWLEARSGSLVAPPDMAHLDPPCPAPGTYVFER